MTKKMVLAGDLGNSKTIMLALQHDGTVVGAGRSGCGDIRVGQDMEQAIESVHEARRQALGQSGCSMFYVDVCAFSAAGADWPEDRRDFCEEIARRGYPHPVVVNDGIGAVYAGCPQNCGVAVVAGTYVATGARSIDGTRRWHSGFWQRGLGATGLGGEAIERVYQAEMGMIAPTRLTGKVLEHFDMDSVEQLLHTFTRRQAPLPQSTDRLARLVLDSAEEGDWAALEVVRQEGIKMCGTAIYAAGKAGFEPGGPAFALAFLGGVFRHQFRLLGDSIAAGFCQRYPQALPSYSRAQPIEGAAVIALEAAGVPVGEKVRDRMRATMPPDSFFAT